MININLLERPFVNQVIEADMARKTWQEADFWQNDVCMLNEGDDVLIAEYEDEKDLLLKEAIELEKPLFKLWMEDRELE